MKTIQLFIISVILLALLTNPVPGYPGMVGNTSGANPGNITLNDQENIDLDNSTQSDQNIILIQHLIEVDAAQFESQNRIYVRETMIFKNIGDKNFSGTLRTWVPDGIENVKVGRVAMMMGSSGEPLNAIQNGNIISWQDIIRTNDPLPPLYAIEYTIPAEPGGTLTKSKYYSKKLVFPTLINQVPLSIVIKITKGTGETITLKDEFGSTISSSGKPMDEENSVLYTWENPQFREINVELSKPALDFSQMALYAIIGLLIVLVLAYPVIRKKSPKIQEMEEKIKNSFKREPSGEEEQEIEEYTEEEPGKEKEGVTEEVKEVAEQETAAGDEELSGKTNDELEVEKNELVSRLEELEKDYASGNLIDEEYEELRNSYQEKLNAIKRQ